MTLWPMAGPTQPGMRSACLTRRKQNPLPGFLWTTGLLGGVLAAAVGAALLLAWPAMFVGLPLGMAVLTLSGGQLGSESYYIASSLAQCYVGSYGRDDQAV